MEKSQFAMIGLGVMGQNFALNVERNGSRVSVYDIDPEATRRYIQEKAADKNITPAFTFEELVAQLETPRRIMILVPAGKPVDSVMEALTPLLGRGDMIIDGGNSYFKDTERRSRKLSEHGIHFLGMGVSGGEEGALWGPSLMPGGPEDAYRRLEPLLTAVAAKAEEDGAPCVTYIGPGGSGHFVKMVHNGIEYGDLQLIAEAYFLLQRLLGLRASELADIFASWNEGELSSFLIEITAEVLRKSDEETGQPLVDLILDKAGQKGTGKWTTQVALDIGAPVPTLTAAVDARILSALHEERQQAARALPGPAPNYDGDKEALIEAVRGALYASKICAYAQGMAMLKMASQEYEYKLNLSEIARIWRAGCIIRAKLLNDIMQAFRANPALPNLLVDEHFRSAVIERQSAWRKVVSLAVENGIPVSAMSASLAYYDAYRAERLPANLIQALRDRFGAHTFERLDKPGHVHANWKE